MELKRRVLRHAAEHRVFGEQLGIEIERALRHVRVGSGDLESMYEQSRSQFADAHPMIQRLSAKRKSGKHVREPGPTAPGQLAAEELGYHDGRETGASFIEGFADGGRATSSEPGDPARSINDEGAHAKPRGRSSA